MCRRIGRWANVLIPSNEGSFHIKHATIPPLTATGNTTQTVQQFNKVPITFDSEHCNSVKTDAACHRKKQLERLQRKWAISEQKTTILRRARSLSAHLPCTHRRFWSTHMAKPNVCACEVTMMPQEAHRRRHVAQGSDRRYRGRDRVQGGALSSDTTLARWLARRQLGSARRIHYVPSPPAHRMNVPGERLSQHIQSKRSCTPGGHCHKPLVTLVPLVPSTTVCSFCGVSAALPDPPLNVFLTPNESWVCS